MSATPQRIQRKRIKGFNLQQESIKLNGLPAISCTRPGIWGNPYKVSGEDGHWFVIDDITPIATFNIKPEAVKCSIGLYREYLAHEVNRNKINIMDLRAKNLACWCKIGEPCHADELLRIANL